MGETRLNLKHLLEDLRDNYPFLLEEVIIIELIANALDSGASSIEFQTDEKQRIMTVIDNGKGMLSHELEEYHDISATTKIRGKGIGFAGLGAKLALLIAKEVITETKSAEFHKATSWKLESPKRAPWDYIELSRLVRSSTGTAVTIGLPAGDSNLLRDSFIEQVIQIHFYPLLHYEISIFLKTRIYKKGVTFSVNNRRIEIGKGDIESRLFEIEINQRPVGLGVICKSEIELPEEERGIAVSTYGKVIKRGWDWIGIIPQNPAYLTGLIEVPKLSEILTTNKADFLGDATSLQKKWRYRKAIQQAIEPFLREFGEISTLERRKVEKELRVLEKEIERVIGNILPAFPELDSLFGRRRRGEPATGVIPDTGFPPIGSLAEGADVITGTKGGSREGGGIEAIKGDIPGEHIEISSQPTERGYQHEGRRRHPGLMLILEDNSDRKEDLGWIEGDFLHINKAHFAYKKAIDGGHETERYHIVLSVAWVLSTHIEVGKSPQKFISDFLSVWGSGL